MNKELERYIEEQVLPCYEGVDPAHGLSHIRTVMENSLRIAGALDVDLDMVYCIAAYHDIGIRFGRDDHEKTSAKWMREDEKLLKFFSAEQIQTMAEAVEDHRASSKSSPRTIYGAIVAEADRDLNPARVLRRCVDFALAHHPLASNEEIVEISSSHLKDKYGPNGYLKLFLHDPINEDGLATLRAWIQNGEAERFIGDYLREIGR
ncbi:MAG: HD domain-containing protein [Bacilli bacterium]|nr:HD domain-containing protein [Bacilli bacterium]